MDRRNRRGPVLLAIAVSVLGLYSCTDDSMAPSVDEGMESRFEGPQSERQRMADVLARKTRALALALGSHHELQQTLETLVHESPFAEGKLEYRALIEDDGIGLAAAMASEGLSIEAVRAAVDSIVALELYFPVDDHRAWRAGEPMLVASLFSDDDPSTLVGYDLTGREVALTLDAPPTEPTLVLVPAETDFSESAMNTGRGPQPSGSAAGPMMAPGSDGLWMTYSYLPDLHEPWPNGDPEIAIHITKHDAAADSMVWIQCAGDNRSGDYYFDQNSNSWSGTVQLGSTTLLEDEDFEVHVLEDDWERCDGSSHLTPHMDVDALDLVELSDLKSLLGVYLDWDGAQWVQKISIAATALQVAYKLLPAVVEDDYIGVAKNIHGNCFMSTTGPVQYSLTDGDGNPVYGSRIYLDDDFEERVLCDLDVYIQGPSEMLDCPFGLSPAGTWYAGYSGGSGTPTFKWWENNELRGTSSSYDLYQTTIGSKTIELQVTRGSEQVHDFREVYVVSSEGREDECLL